MLWLRPPLVPVSVSACVPSGAVNAVVRVIAAVPEGVTGLGAIAAVTPAGSPLNVSCTGSVKSYRPVIVVA